MDATNEEKVRIASSFLKAAPPGEINDVFMDVRALVNDDELLQTSIVGALEEYNTEQLSTIQVPGIEKEVLVSKFGQIDSEHFLDPRSSQVFKLDHIRQVASDLEPHEAVEAVEPLRKAVEKEVDIYVGAHFAEGVSAVYGTEESITVAIVHNKYSPSNYWNGRWRSIWSYDIASGAVKGQLKGRVHFYEDGNVQLETSKEIDESVSKDSKDEAAIAKAFLKLVSTSEQEYQTALNESYHDLAENTFKGLRRALPLTRNKLDWNKILTYKIGQELSTRDTI